MNRNLKSRDIKNLMKLLCILAGMAILFMIWLNSLEIKKEIPQGEGISIEDVRILMQALGVSIEFGENENGVKTASESTDAEQNELTYGQYRSIYERIGGSEMDIPEFAEKYEDSYIFIKEDWYEAYKFMLAYFDTDSSIWKTTVFIIKVDEQNRKLYTQNGEYEYLSSSFKDAAFSKEEVYVKGEQLLTCTRVLPEETILENVWVMEINNGNQGADSGKGILMECFYHQIAFTVPSDSDVAGAASRESVADLTFGNGRLIRQQQKPDKIRGKLLSVSDGSIEIEGYGTYETEDKLEVYKLCGTLEALKKSDLMIGYDYTDFVIWNNKICAALVSREGETDQIRVLLKNTGNGSYYYDEAVVTVDGQQTRIKADEMKEGERISFQSAALTDMVKLDMEGVVKENNQYRGSLEFYKTAQGMAIINELPLEEYLYAVVPSEMPSYYPIEALKAQAVCARTYAARFILHAGLPAFGAHLDDTTSYQVYHNIAENSATTTAVKETSGMVLYHQGELAENYYYSTSCGYGTDTKIWKTGNGQAIDYIQAVKLAPGEDSQNTQNAEEMEQEENFYKYICSVDETDFESNEPWYRWQYEVSNIDTAALLERIKERYNANASLILVQKGKEGEYYYVSEEINDIGNLEDICISKRGVGGIADEMIITGSKAVIKVISEYNIRRILCNGESKVIRQDGSSVGAGTLLPSAFLIIEADKKGEDMVGYTLVGGGYGHGVGMSQNCAKEMGNQGYDYKEILESFFSDCEVKS
ncbi:MAG: SpoIID/LytB domain-containing protein [Lachnospiraceae bacterium]|nr:SpoIID/LytB domain-containing protein [Lachnospiraceae bacterium]